MQRTVISSDTKDARLGPKMKHGTHDENMRVEAAAKLMKSAKLLLKPKGGSVDSNVSATRQPDVGSVSIDEPRSAGGQATKALPNVPLQPKGRDGSTTTTIVTTVTTTTATSSEKKAKKHNANWHVKNSLRQRTSRKTGRKRLPIGCRERPKKHGSSPPLLSQPALHPRLL